MIPKKFDYYAPDSLSDAIRTLHEKEDSKIVAGGQSLLALMKLRLATPTVLVDITKVKENLSYVRREEGYLSLGSLTAHDMIERNDTIRGLFPILTDAASRIGDQQIRNVGTVGGSCCHADPSADLPTALTALDPQFVVRGTKGERVIPCSEFFVDTFTTSLARDEVLTEIRVPHLPRNSGSAYMKHSRREGDFALVGVGGVVTLEKNQFKDVRISLGAVAPTPMRARSSEKYLIGKNASEQAIAEAAERATEGADPPADMHGSREYRLDMIKVFTRRVLRLALSRV